MPPEFITVTAPKGRTVPINPSDGNDPAGVLLYVTHERVCRVRYAASDGVRRGVRDGDLIPVVLVEEKHENGTATYTLKTREPVRDPKTGLETKETRPFTVEEAESKAPMIYGDRIDLDENGAPTSPDAGKEIPRADPAVDEIAVEVAREAPINPMPIPLKEVAAIRKAETEPDITAPANGAIPGGDK